MSPGPDDRAASAIGEILVHAEPHRYRAVAIGGGRAVDLMTVPRPTAGTIGSIYFGRVVRVVGGMKGAFVDIGLERPAFLSIDRAVPAEGKPVAVQLVEQASAGKAPRVSRRIAIEGRFLVLLPNGRGIAPSRRLDEEDRKRLAGVLEPHLKGQGVIVRAAAAAADPPALIGELDVLRSLWEDVASRMSGNPPACIHAEHGLRRILCTFGAPSARFVFSEPQSVREARNLAKTVGRGLEDSIALAEEGEGIFDRYGVADVLAAVGGPEVTLASGGRLSIETTAALTAIDVDSGAGSAAAEAALTANLEGAGEIGLQLRLRELGGPVVIDFIRMSRKGDHDRVLRRLAQSVESDRLAVQVLGWTRGGLFELNRARSGYEG